MLKDRIVMVTGATNGIGEVTAHELAAQGASVVIVSRSEDKCRDTVARIKAETGQSDVHYIVADLSSLAGIRQAAADFRAMYDRLDVLVNNAGGYFNDRQLSPDGYELTFALNHLNYFLLTHELLDLLQRSGQDTGDARIVNVSSEAHRMANGIDFDDLQREEKYAGFNVYAETKLMNIMFTLQLAEMLDGSGVTVNAVHPGFVRSGFGRNNNWLVSSLVGLAQIFAKSPEQGAETNIYLASSPDVAGITGKYWSDSKQKEPADVAFDRQQWEQLWNVSAELCGLAGVTA